MARRVPLTIVWVATACVAVGAAVAFTEDLADSFFDAINHPAINYSTTPPDDPVARLSRRLQDGSAQLEFDGRSGYLPALLHALDISPESQLTVFSKTSLQRAIISPANPRAIYFNDAVFVAWPRGGFVEIASHDPTQGVMFYMLPQQPGGAQIFRRMDCLTCHHSYATLGVPGLLVRSIVTGAGGDALPFLGNYTTDDRSPVDERWAGWFVTGTSGGARHLGNQMIRGRSDPETLVAAHESTLTTVPGNLEGYPSTHSDIVAHLVFDHETHVINLLTRVGWEVRLASAEGRNAADVARRAAAELVDALLFVGEAPLAGGIRGQSGFAEPFAARGPADRIGRSLRDLDLRTRLMRYPCSFMVYSDAFDALPRLAQDATYRRMWDVLSGAETSPRYARLSAADRTAILQILRDTKKGLPDYFKQP